MVKNLIRHHPVNQEGLLHCHGPSIIGAMLSKVSAQHHASLCSSKWELFAGNQLASDSEDLTFFIVLLLRNCYEMNGFGVLETAAALSE